MMKRYLMTGLAVVAMCGLFSGCSKDIETGEDNVEFNIIENYENAFMTRFGQPAETLTWGFGDVVAGTRGHNANANEWADPTKEYGGWTVPDPLTEKQKLRVKAYFQAIQYPGGTNCNYKDFFVQQVYKGNPQTKGPHSDEQYQSANGGWVVGSNHMDHLTAGSIHDHINNFNYGDYSGGGTVTVLDNGQYVNGGTTHQDQIMLMVNSQTDCFGYWNSDGSLGHDDRYRLVSAAVIDQWAKDYGNNIGEPVTDKWNRSFIGFDFDQVAGNDVYAKNNGSIIYAKYTESPAGNAQYAWDGQNLIPMTSVAGVADNDITNLYINNNSPKFWNDSESINVNSDGTITYHAAQWGGWKIDCNFQDISKYKKIVVEFAEATQAQTQICIPVNKDWSITSQYAGPGATRLELDITNNYYNLQNLGQLQIAIQAGAETTLKIRRIYLKGQEGVQGLGEYITYNGKQVPYLTAETNQYCGTLVKLNDTDLKTNQFVAAANSNQDCLNLKKINEMLAAGYLPVSGSNMKDWVKVHGGADGYYSDWIVTICKATQDTEVPPVDPPIDPPTPPTGFVCRIIAEDLTVGENSDFDFNDVVFDVINGGTTLRLRAAGGELPLYVAGKEVHAAFASKYSGITPTTLVNTGWKGSVDYVGYYVDIPSGGSYSTPESAVNIPVIVHKNGKQITLTAQRAKVASKVAVGSDFEWCSERQDIDAKFHKADGTKLFQQYVIGKIGDDWRNGNAWYQQRGK